MRVVNSYAEVPHPNRGDDRGSRLTDYAVLVGAVILFNNQHVQSACIEQESVGVLGRNLLGDGVICAAPLEPASVRLTVAKKF